MVNDAVSESVPQSPKSSQVSVCRTKQVIPTHLPLAPDRCPAYLDNRVYQGMSGAVYPLPFHERIASEPSDHPWDVITLRNDWVELAIMPELGGRVAWGIDRTRDYDVFYRNSVLKPALVGLAGPWISGGIEFNWPQHHRPATFLPTSVDIEEEPDGSVTVWCSDHDPFARMKGMHGVRLRPDSAVIELRVRLFNRTNDVQTFLWWANVAARAGEHYQSFFPTDVHFVADHARRAVTAFPAADRPYYGWDYPAAARQRAGADRLDWYRNIPVPTSYMCIETADDFFGGYDHEVGAGFVHLADHRIAPGKKQWTWGNSPFGWAWDANLTETDGPYVELMAGVYTDNQPDFSFLMPGETKTFSQFWYPFQDIGPVHQATLDAAGRLDVDGRRLRLGVAVTAPRRGVHIAVTAGQGEEMWSSEVDLAPGRGFEAEVDLDAAQPAEKVRLLVTHGGETLLDWTPRQRPKHPAEPEPATEPPAPGDIASTDELYVTGLHLEQYHHATRRPEPYWLEAVRRDPGDARSRVALAVGCLRRGELGEAQQHLEQALARLTRRNPNPADSEAYYRLGQVLDRSGEVDAALDAYGKAAWNLTWRDAAHLAMARLMARRGHNCAALDLVRDAGSPRDPRNQAVCLEVILLRRLGRHDEAGAKIDRLRRLDPLDLWAADLVGAEVETDGPCLLDVALEYLSVGEDERGLDLLSSAARCKLPLGQVNIAPLAHLYRADTLARLGRDSEAEDAFRDAMAADATWCFPSRPTDLDLLTRLTRTRPEAALPFRLLGHQLYHLRRRDEAIDAWRRAIDLDDSDPVTRRNLAVASYNVDRDAAASLTHYRRAQELAPDDPRLLYEVDQLRKRDGVAPEERLHRLAARRELVEQRDDLTVEYAQLLTFEQRPEEALDVLAHRRFQPWEGGEGLVLSAWEDALSAMARSQLRMGRAEDAVESLRRALEPPPTLGEARHTLANFSALLLPLGDALQELGRSEEARQAWSQAASFVGDFRTMAAVPFSDMTYYSVLASQRLGDDERAARLLDGLATWAEQLDRSVPSVDYFATSLPSLLLFTEDLARRQRVEVSVLRAQVALLRGQPDEAQRQLDGALTLDPNHPRARQLASEVGCRSIAESR